MGRAAGVVGRAIGSIEGAMRACVFAQKRQALPLVRSAKWCSRSAMAAMSAAELGARIRQL